MAPILNLSLIAQTGEKLSMFKRDGGSGGGGPKSFCWLFVIGFLIFLALCFLGPKLYYVLMQRRERKKEALEASRVPPEYWTTFPPGYTKPRPATEQQDGVTTKTETCEPQPPPVAYQPEPSRTRTWSSVLDAEGTAAYAAPQRPRTPTWPTRSRANLFPANSSIPNHAY